MYLSTLEEWLAKIASLPIKEISLGLERVKEVARRLDILDLGCPVILVGGTNGKGSTVAALESIYRSAGFKTGTYTSPFLFRYNEQISIQNIPVSDDSLCEAFKNIEAARLDTLLTPFEFGTLAALWLFKRAQLDVCVLEVGLGGRLDAVNIIEPCASIVTSIGIDHTEWLGETREAIGFEKAGIFRSHLPAICGDAHPPASLIEHAKAIHANFFVQGKDFSYQVEKDHWSWRSETHQYDQLPFNSLLLSNMSAALMAVMQLQDKLPVKVTSIRQGLSSIQLIGRMQVINGSVTEIYDVSHNPDSVRILAERLKQLPAPGKTYAVFSMLRDKDRVTTLSLIEQEIDDWYVAPLANPRATPLSELKATFAELHISEVTYLNTIEEAYCAALAKAKTGDRIVIFGSFHTVADVMRVARRI